MIPGVVVFEGEITGSASGVSIGCVDDTVRPLADVILGSSSNPGVLRISLGSNFAIADRQTHLIDRVNCLIQTTPPQQRVRPTVNQGQCLGAQVQRQTLGCGHMKEPVTRTPLPQLGLAV